MPEAATGFRAGSAVPALSVIFDGGLGSGGVEIGREPARYPRTSSKTASGRPSFLANEVRFATYDDADSLSLEEFDMRALLIALFGLVIASDLAFAQMKLPSKAAPGGVETRYFTSID